ncbi:MAG: flagellar export chaperone FliS [Planctomycetes bacterium]|jgi:flagellar protein FliS|nr:flagellar export chaperone FliS [Planctomycetota bacterium]
MSYAQAAATYQRNAVLTASPEKLVKLLYEGAIKNLEKSKLGLADAKTARSPEVGQALSRAMGILGELRASLDHAAGGQIAKDLDRLYEFSLDQLSQANLTRTPTGVTNTLQVMRTLQEGWNGIIAN